jgi:hypothetical protein
LVGYFHRISVLIAEVDCIHAKRSSHEQSRDVSFRRS